MTAAEHFDWAVGRAMEYVELDDPGNAPLTAYTIALLPVGGA